MVAARWKEHFELLLNGQSNGESSENRMRIQKDGQAVEPPTPDEVRKAVQALKNGKAAGKDGIPAELLKTGSERLYEAIHAIIAKIWVDEELPPDWLDGLIIDSIVQTIEHPVETYGYAFLFSLSGYLGIQIVLTLVRTCGAPLAATVITARKAVTIALSFVFFSKPFTINYLWSGLIVVIGIYLNVYSKRSKLTFTDINRVFLRIYYKLRPQRGGSSSSTKKLLLEV